MVQVFAVAHADVQVHPRPFPGQVTDDPDLAVGNAVNSAVQISQHCPPQVHLLYQPGDAGDTHHVSLSKLVLKNDEETIKSVPDKALGPEAYGDTGNPNAGQDRRDANSYLVKNSEQGRDYYHHRHRLGDYMS